MQIKPSNLESTLRNAKLPAQHRTFFFYGPDSGAASILISNLKKYFSSQYKTDIEPYNTTYKAITSEADNGIYNRLQGQSLFSSIEMVIVDDVPPTINSNIINNIKASENSILIFRSAEIKKTSGTYKYFTSRQDVVIVPCYEPNEAEMQSYIKNILHDHKKELSAELIYFLSTKFPANQMIVYNELLKLITYIGDRTEITGDAIIALFSDNSDMQYDLLCSGILTGDIKNLKSQLTKLEENEDDAMAIVRIFQNYIKRLMQASSALNTGMSIDQAMASLRPPVFFKQKDSFGKALRAVDFKSLKLILKDLISCELQIKKNTNNEFLMQKLVELVSKRIYAH